jgi:hypothetical protein
MDTRERAVHASCLYLANATHIAQFLISYYVLKWGLVVADESVFGFMCEDQALVSAWATSDTPHTLRKVCFLERHDPNSSLHALLQKTGEVTKPGHLQFFGRSPSSQGLVRIPQRFSRAIL